MPQSEDSRSARVRVDPSMFAAALRESLDRDVLAQCFDPSDASHRRELALWARNCGLFNSEISQWASLKPVARIAPSLARSWIDNLVSLHPERFREVEKTCRALQEKFLRKQIQRLEECGEPWVNRYVVRIFFLDHHGRERLRRQIGIHRCKQAWCPTCGRTRQGQLTVLVEKILILSQEFGFHEGHGRFVTLTVPNGSDITALREQAHKGFAKLQRTRWWNRHVFGSIRGTEVVTGRDGNWNMHIHLLVLFWSPSVSYQEISQKWTEELGGPRENGKNYVVDCQSLELIRWNRKDGSPNFLKRRAGLLRAARYITKYLSKPEDLQNLASGPRGMAHLLTATKGLRRFSCGGGMALLRRASNTLLPDRIHRAEEALAGSYLHQGRPPCRIELLDPHTGKVVKTALGPLQDNPYPTLQAWGERLETNPIPKP